MSKENIRVPGKLILNGEYAITIPGNKALVFAINRFLSKNKSELTNKKGTKYGLGSSGAYAVLKCRYANKKADDHIIFKKALKFSRRKQPQNSGADIAASTFGGFLLYENGKLPKKLSFPKKWNLLVGWTGQPASTASLVSMNALTNQFLIYSQKNVNQMINSILNRDFHLFEITIDRAEKNLEKLKGTLTKKIALGIKIANYFGIKAKISGAGGGDCIIAFSKNQLISEKIKKVWKKNGISPLNLKIYYKNKNEKKLQENSFFTQKK